MYSLNASQRSGCLSIYLSDHANWSTLGFFPINTIPAIKAAVQRANHHNNWIQAPHRRCRSLQSATITSRLPNTVMTMMMERTTPRTTVSRECRTSCCSCCCCSVFTTSSTKLYKHTTVSQRIFYRLYCRNRKRVCTLNKMLPSGLNWMDQHFSHTGLLRWSITFDLLGSILFSVCTLFLLTSFLDVRVLFSYYVSQNVTYFHLVLGCKVWSGSIHTMIEREHWFCVPTGYLLGFLFF